MKIDRVKPSGINKDISPAQVDNAGSRVIVNPYIDRLNSRFRSSENGDITAEQNIPGTALRNNTLPSGTNLTIGAFTDREGGRIIYFNHNSDNNHGIYSWNPITNTFSTLIQSSILAFSNNPRYRITGIGIAQNLLYWTDGLNPPRMINMTRNYAGITDDAVINLYKRPPILQPGHALGLFTYLSFNTDVKTSAIAGNIYQFCSRYVYLDNEISAPSPYTEWIAAGPNDTLTDFAYNFIQLRLFLEVPVKPVVKSVQLLYRKNNSPTWYVYAERPTASFSVPITNFESCVFEFYDDNANSPVPDSEVSKLFDSVPLKSKSLSLFKNRNFIASDVEGYDNTQSQDFNFLTDTNTHVRAVKEGGVYSIGVVYWDEDGRTNGVVSSKTTRIEYELGITGGFGSQGIDITKRKILSFRFLDNNHPSWARRVSVGVSKEQAYESYMQIPTKPMFYVSEGEIKDLAGATVPVPANMEKYNNGKVYLKQLPNNTTNIFSKIHFQVPQNIPFIPDSSYNVRIITPLTGITNVQTLPVLDFVGNYIVCDNIAGFNWSASGFNSAGPLIIEVFKVKKDASKQFYENGAILLDLPVFLPDNPIVLFRPIYDTWVKSPSILVGGPTSADAIFVSMKTAGGVSDPCYNVSNLGFNVNFESPSPINSVESSEKTEYSAKSYVNIVSARASTVNYERIPDAIGRAIAFNPNAKQSFRPTTIRYSDPFIQNSKINGLSSFLALNEYDLPTYRSPITKLQSAGNVLLAIHERCTTSLYVGEGFIKNADGSDQALSKTDSVIGTDRELAGAFGSYHPESIAEWGSIVFGFDIFKGVIWRYDNNGQVPVSDFGMKTYFLKKAQDYLPYKDQVAIVGGIDPYHKEYIITFPAIGDLTAETWAFDFANNEWIGRYSFIGDCYAYINNNLVSFKNGQLWLHNTDKANCNTFYGVKYPRLIRFAFNPFPAQQKNYAAMQIIANELTNGDRFPVQNYANQAAFPGTGTAGIQYEDRSVTDPVTGVGKRFIWNGSAYVDIGNDLVVNCYTKDGQATYMRRREFTKETGIFYGPILKDINTPTALMEAGTLKLRSGKDMIGRTLEVEIQNNSTDLSPQYFVNISYTHLKFSA